MCRSDVLPQDHFCLLLLTLLELVKPQPFDKPTHQVCRAIAKQRPRFISLPSTVVDTRRVDKGFCRLSKVIGTVDCSHIQIQGLGTQKIICISTAIFRLINYCSSYLWVEIMVKCSEREKAISLLKCTVHLWSMSQNYMDIVSRWPGSCHNQIISDTSVIKIN